MPPDVSRPGAAKTYAVGRELLGAGGTLQALRGIDLVLKGETLGLVATGWARARSPG